MTDRWSITGPRKDVEVHRIAGAVEDPNLDHRSDGKRATYGHRTEVMDYLSWAFSVGALNQDVFDARHNAASQAVTVQELRHLTSDLPERPPQSKIDTASPTFVLLEHAAWAVLSVVFAIVPGALIAGAGVISGNGPLVAVWAPTMTIGLASLILCIAHLNLTISKASNT